MRLVILGRPDSWHVQQFQSAGERSGHEVLVAPFDRLTAWFGNDYRLQVGHVNLLAFDAAIVRGIPPGSLEQIVFRMDALHRLQHAGLAVLNPPAAIEACVDKYLATARLAAAGLPVPRTAVCENLDEALEAFTRLGGDVVVKPLFGSEGRGMVRVSDESLAYRTLRALATMNCVLYLQEYVPHPGYDVRVLVLEGQMLAAMRRTTAVGDFRTNVARGGGFERFEPPDEWIDLACRSAVALGAPFAGVDLLSEVNGQPLVLEVNSVPGFHAMAQTTSVDIPAAVIDYLERRLSVS